MLSALAKRLLLVCLTALCAASALAADQPNKNAAAALATRAAKAFEAGKMAEAEGLYREAFHIDKTEPAYLYGAARAAHAGRDLVHAEHDYVAFLSLPNSDPVRFRKAEKYLASLRAELSGQKATEAKAAEDSGDLLLAATLYLEAWRIAPDAPEPLLKAAILERKRGDKPAAIGHLQQYLNLAPLDAPGIGTAETLLKELGGKPLPPTPPAGLPPSQPIDVPAPATEAAAPQAPDVTLPWAPFGGSLGDSAAFGPGSHLTAHFSIPVARPQPLGRFQHFVTFDVAASIVVAEKQAEDFIPRLGLNWFVRFLPNVLAFARPHLDWHVVGYNGYRSVAQDDGTIVRTKDHANRGGGFGIDLGGIYKIGPIALIAEIGTQHAGLAVGLGY